MSIPALCDPYFMLRHSRQIVKPQDVYKLETPQRVSAACLRKAAERMGLAKDIACAMRDAKPSIVHEWDHASVVLREGVVVSFLRRCGIDTDSLLSLAGVLQTERI